MPIVGRSSNLPEKLVVDIWKHKLAGRTDLVTEEGETVRIIYPGMENTGRGADLKDAVIATENGIIIGDVEVHVRTSGWRAHHHHLDPLYNRVILHIVYWHDGKAATKLQNGKTVPTLALYRYIKQPEACCKADKHNNAGQNIMCHNAVIKLGGRRMGELLDAEGERRFLAKADRFEAESAIAGAGQILYRGMMQALGYNKNTGAFAELAERVPFQVLETIVNDERADERCLVQQQALLFGTAGLLPSQSNALKWSREKGEWSDKLERSWAIIGQTETMSEYDWELFKVRPNNFPMRRIAAISYLMLRYRGKQLLDEIVNLIRESSAEKGYLKLEKMLLVSAGGYWANHFDFGPASRLTSPTLIGRRRAADIVINILLPFTFSWGRINSQPQVARKALEIYQNYPGVAANTVEKHMRKQLGLGGNMVNSARQQQGLLHIYRTLCSQGKCCCCPVGESVTETALAASVV